MVHVHQPQLCPNAPASRGSEVLPSTRMNPNPQTLRTQDGQDIGTENNIATVKQKLTRTAIMMIVMIIMMVMLVVFVVIIMIVMLTILVIITTIIFGVLVSFSFTVAIIVFFVPVF